MTERPDENKISAALSRFLEEDPFDSRGDAGFIFYDLGLIGERVRELFRLFPEGTLHTVAVKANPLKRILNFISDLGAGFETASLPELKMALNSGAGSKQTVFDSPVKTVSELKFALERGVHINADSLTEVERISEILSGRAPECHIGIRINPQTGAGSIASTSVAGEYSKFGVPLKEKRGEIIGIYKKYHWLNMIHLHTGSQGCDPGHLVRGIRKTLDLALEINRITGGQIRCFDMGGGMPVQYRESDPLITMETYRNMLASECPELFSGEFNLITEFGRTIHANAGWAVSRVEYVKEYSRNTLMIHFGADLLIRKCYNPEDWHHDIFLTGPDGALKLDGPRKKYTIAGPLCFAGDIIGRDIGLPAAEEGDFLVIRDTGAYTLSMWSRYNSRQVPGIIGIDRAGTFVLLKKRETPEDTIRFWE